MINLLSYEKRDEIRAGRTNVLVVNYILMTLAAGLLVSLMVGGAYVALGVARTNAQNRVADNNAEASHYAQTEQEAEQFRSNLATAKQIIDKEVNYSKLITKITQALPPGVVLDSLSLDSSLIGTPISLSAHAKDNTATIALKTSFENNHTLFSNVHFDTINYDSSGNSSYPISISISVTINKAAL